MGFVNSFSILSIVNLSKCNVQERNATTEIIINEEMATEGMKEDIMESMKDHIEEMNTSEESEMDVMEST